MKIKDINIYIDVSCEILNLSDITNIRHNKQIKYVLSYALELGFDKKLLIRKYKLYNGYFTMLNHRNPNIRQSKEYLDLKIKIKNRYDSKISNMSKIEENNIIINNLRDRLLVVLQEKKQLQYKIKFMQKEERKRKKDLSTKKTDFRKKTEEIILDFNLKDSSIYNAKYHMNKLTKMIYPDCPIDNFNKRQYFLGLKSKKK